MRSDINTSEHIYIVYLWCKALWIALLPIYEEFKHLKKNSQSEDVIDAAPASKANYYFYKTKAFLMNSAFMRS